MIINIDEIFNIAISNYKDHDIDIELTITINQENYYTIILYPDFNIKYILDNYNHDIFELNYNQENNTIEYQEITRLIKHDELFYEELKTLIYEYNINESLTIEINPKKYQLQIEEIIIKIDE